MRRCTIQGTQALQPAVTRPRAGRVFTAILLLLAVTLFAPCAAAAVLTVGSGYSSIQDAVDHASARDTVLVPAGVYYEQVRITKPLNLTGTGGAKGQPLLVPSGTAGILIRSDQVTVSGLRIAVPKGMTGVMVQGSGMTLSGIAVANGSTGILIESGTKNRVTGSTVSGATLFGLRIQSGDNTVTGSTLRDNAIGVLVAETAAGNRFYLNDFANTVNSFDRSSSSVWESDGPLQYRFGGKEYNSPLGNFWSDYTGTSSDGSGIGSTPYTGSAALTKNTGTVRKALAALPATRVLDRHPLLRPAGSYTLIRPASETAGTTATPAAASPDRLQRVSLADLLRKPAFAAVAAAAVVAAVAIMIFYTWRRRQKSTTTGTLHGAGARTSGTGGADPGKTVLAGEDIPAGFPRELAPRYRNLKLISSGGIARVYSAVRAGDGETVAVKIPLQPDRSTGTSFIKEITARARLSHKNIVRIYDVNILPVPYIEMEYCRSSLADIKKPLPVQDAVGMVREILSGLAYAHGQGTIHRDVKPGNILLCRDNVPKIADWGLSAARDLPNAPTITGFSLSSAAPEQVAPADFGEPDERTDIYGAGIILYELVTGSLPFSDGSVAEMCRQVTQVTPQPPSAYGGHLVLLDPIVMKCLQKHKDDRYQSAGDLDRDLAAITLPREG